MNFPKLQKTCVLLVNTALESGEAMPAAEEMHILGRFSRRALLGAIASVPAIGAAAAAFAVATPPNVFSNFGGIAAVPVEHPDPLLDAIRAFREGLADYNANAPQDDAAAEAYAEMSYVPPMAVLEEWEEPATTRRGALEALRLIAEENDDFAASPVVGPLLAAALAYFEAVQS